VTTASNPSRVSKHGTQQIHVPRTIRASSAPPLLPLLDLRPTAPSSRDRTRVSAPLTPKRRQMVNSNDVANGNRVMALLTLSVHGHLFFRLTTEWYSSTSLLPCNTVQQEITPENTRSSSPENMAGKRGRERYGARKDIGRACLLQRRHRLFERQVSIHIRCLYTHTITKRSVALLSLMYFAFHLQSVRC